MIDKRLLFFKFIKYLSIKLIFDYLHHLGPKKLTSLMKLPKTREVMAESLIKMLIAGPDVSLSGSPTVSPTTAATCNSFITSALSEYCLSLAQFASPSLRAARSSLIFPMFTPSFFASALNADLLFSISFLAMSQAPPVFEAEMATQTPETIIPARSPSTAAGPKKIPAINGDKITSAPGKTIFLNEALVEIIIHPQ